MACLTPHGVGLPDPTAPCPTRAPPAVGRALESPPAGWIEPIPRPARWLGKRGAPRFGRLDRLTRLALVVANAALEEAGRPADPHLAGIVLGTAYGSHLANEGFQLQLERKPAQEASPSLFTYTLPSSSVGEISIHFGIQGPTMTLVQGTGAGLSALGLAKRIIERGEAPWVLAGAADTLGSTLLAAERWTAAPPAEGAALLCLSAASDRALARISGAAGGRRTEEVEALALEQAHLRRDDLRERLLFDGSDPATGLAASHGRSASAGPVLGACALVGALGLPALVTAIDPRGTVDVVCLDLPAGGSPHEAGPGAAGSRTER